MANSVAVVLVLLCPCILAVGVYIVLVPFSTYQWIDMLVRASRVPYFEHIAQCYNISSKSCTWKDKNFVTFDGTQRIYYWTVTNTTNACNDTHFDWTEKCQYNGDKLWSINETHLWNSNDKCEDWVSEQEVMFFSSYWFWIHLSVSLSGIFLCFGTCCYFICKDQDERLAREERERHDRIARDNRAAELKKEKLRLEAQKAANDDKQRREFEEKLQRDKKEKERLHKIEMEKQEKMHQEQVKLQKEQFETMKRIKKKLDRIRLEKDRKEKERLHRIQIDKQDKQHKEQMKFEPQFKPKKVNLSLINEEKGEWDVNTVLPPEPEYKIQMSSNDDDEKTRGHSQYSSETKCKTDEQKTNEPSKPEWVLDELIKHKYLAELDNDEITVKFKDDDYNRIPWKIILDKMDKKYDDYVDKFEAAEEYGNDLYVIITEKRFKNSLNEKQIKIEREIVSLSIAEY